MNSIIIVTATSQIYVIVFHVAIVVHVCRYHDERLLLS